MAHPQMLPAWHKAAQLLERRPLLTVLSQGAARLMSTSEASGSKPSAPVDQGTSSPVVGQAQPSDAWVEVVHEASGQTYWWNQKTGQTTALGEVKPSSGGSYGQGGDGTGAGAIDPRAETPLPDKTGQFAAIGAVAGILLGWASQFF